MNDREGGDGRASLLRKEGDSLAGGAIPRLLARRRSENINVLNKTPHRKSGSVWAPEKTVGELEESKFLDHLAGV